MMGINTQWSIPRVVKLKEKCPYHKCPICGCYGFRKGEVVLKYLRDCWQGKFELRMAHIKCAMRSWDVWPSCADWREAQRINLLEAV